MRLSHGSTFVRLPTIESPSASPRTADDNGHISQLQMRHRYVFFFSAPPLLPLFRDVFVPSCLSSSIVHGAPPSPFLISSCLFTVLSSLSRRILVPSCLSPRLGSAHRLLPLLLSSYSCTVLSLPWLSLYLCTLLSSLPHRARRTPYRFPKFCYIRYSNFISGSSPQ